MNFVSIAPEQIGKSHGWSKYLLQHLRSIEDTEVILILEDFFPTSKPNVPLINKILNLFSKNQKIGRFDLTYDTFSFGAYTIIKKLSSLNLLSKDRFMEYRISTQPSLWNKEYLMKILEKTSSPWDFEVNGSRYSNSLEYHVMAFEDRTYKNFPTYWIHKGAVSRQNPGKVNVLGIDCETIKEMVELGLFKESDLQWGVWNNGHIPSFHELGGYNFDPSQMPPNEASRSNWREYYHVYNKNRLVVNLFDRCFSHTMQLWGYISSNGNDVWGKPKNITYVEKQLEFNGITVFTDHYLTNRNLIENVKSTHKVAWICEPRNIHQFAYKGIEQNIDLFDLVVTWNQELIDKYDNCKLMPVMETRVAEKDWGIKEKSKLVSLIASSKTTTPGHKFRFEITNKFASPYKIDLWGSAFNKFESKTEPLEDYYFSITVHNNKEDNLFTDALLDCFALGTIPVFWGCPNIGEFFDEKGIITFDNLEELESILGSLTPELYRSMLPSIERNHEIAKKYKPTKDDQLYSHLRKEFNL